MNSHNLIIGWNILDLVNKNTGADQILPPKKGNGEEIHQEEENDRYLTYSE